MLLASWTKSKYIYLGFLTAVIRYFSPFPSQRIFMCRSSPPRLKPIAKFPNQDQRICFHIFFLKWFFGPWYFIKITKMWKLYALSEFLNHILTKFPNQDQRICFLIFLLKCFFGIKVFWNNQDYRIFLHIFFLENLFLCIEAFWNNKDYRICSMFFARKWCFWDLDEFVSI